MKAAFSSGFSKGPGPLEKGITLRPAQLVAEGASKPRWILRRHNRRDRMLKYATGIFS